MVKHARILVAAIATMLMIVGGGTVAAQDGGAAFAFAQLQDVEGAEVGRVTWTTTDGGVRIDAEVDGLPPGFHGFHIHAVGLCEPPFTSAGGHLDLGDTGHPEHTGDMPVLLVNADGTAETTFVTDRYSVNDLFGAGVIIHAGPDNYANIPERYAPDGPDEATLASGDAGGRIACGTIAVPRPAQ